MFLVVGLGNPGREYANTRHNVGFDAIDYLAYKNNVTINKLKFNAAYGDYSVNGEKVILFKPTTYMNNSGIAVSEIAKFYKIPVENIIVIYDDIDIGVGSLRVRPHGSSGTHNGMKSIIYHLKSDKFPRIRIGIGRNPDMDLADFVLSKFSSEDRIVINDMCKKAGDAAEDIIQHDLNHSMQTYNIKC